MARKKLYSIADFDLGNLGKFKIEIFIGVSISLGVEREKIVFDLKNLSNILNIAGKTSKVVFNEIVDGFRASIMKLDEVYSVNSKGDYVLEVVLKQGFQHDDYSKYSNNNRLIVYVVRDELESYIQNYFIFRNIITSATSSSDVKLSTPPPLSSKNIKQGDSDAESISLKQTNTNRKKDNNNQAKLEQLKLEMAQLLFLKSIVSPIDLEQNIKISQLILEKQKQINELNFYIIEDNINSFDIFEDLFEQSFNEISHSYDNIYSPNDETIDFFTPNGRRSELSVELNEIIRSPQFKEWFGDWELYYLYKDTDAVEIECSKVLTENFEPRVVWHGTGKEFSYFRFDNFPAAYFAVKKEYSQWFADMQGGEDGYTIPFFLNIRNPLDLTMFSTKEVSPKDFFDYLYLKTGMDTDELGVNPIFLEPDFPNQKIWIFLRNNSKMLKIISDSSLFDGIHFYETNPNVPEGEPAHETEAYITFFENQAKIAAPNRGLILLSSLKSFLLNKGGKI